MGRDGVVSHISLISLIWLSGASTRAAAAGLARRFRPQRNIRATVGYQKFRVDRNFRHLFLRKCLAGIAPAAGRHSTLASRRLGNNQIRFRC